MDAWDNVVNKWLPVVQFMEKHGFEDYAIPEIFRAAESRMEEIRRSLDEILESLPNEEE